MSEPFAIFPCTYSSCHAWVHADLLERTVRHTDAKYKHKPSYLSGDGKAETELVVCHLVGLTNTV